MSATVTGPAFTTAATFTGLAVLAVWVWRQDRFSGRTLYLLCLAGLVWWLAAAFLEQVQPALDCKVTFAIAAWPGIVAAPVAWFFFLGRYCFGHEWRLVRYEGPLIGALVVVLPAFALSNAWHHLFYGQETRLVTENGILFAVYDHGPLFYVVTFVLYFFLLFSMAVVGAAAFRSPKEQRPHFMLLLFGTFAPVAANIAYNYYSFTFFGFDPTPFAFSFVLVSMSWAVFASRMFDLSAVARDIIYFNIADPVFVIDMDRFIVAMNPAARQLLPNLDVGVSLYGNMALAGIQRRLDADDELKAARFDIQLSDRVFDCRLLPISRPLAKERSLLGIVALLTDATVERRRLALMANSIERFSEQLSNVAAKLDAAEQSALTDPLTRLGNRRAFELAQNSSEIVASRPSLAVIDLDHFKEVNDALGHVVGDAALRLFAAELVGLLPKDALAFRTGGEEFVVLYPALDQAQAAAEVARFADHLKDHNPLHMYPLPPLAFSAGVAGPANDTGSIADLYAIADGRMYEAKRSGRGCVIAGTGPADNGVNHAAATIARSLDAETVLADRLAEGQRRLSPLVRRLARSAPGERNDLIVQILAEVGNHCGADRAYVFWFDDASAMTNTHEWCQSEVTPQIGNLRHVPISLLDNWMPLLRGDEPFEIPDVAALPATDAALKEHLLDQNIQALLLAPLNDGSALRGFIGIEAVRSRPKFDTADMALLRAISDVLAVVIADEQLPDEVPHHADGANGERYRALMSFQPGPVAGSKPQHFRATEAEIDLATRPDESFSARYAFYDGVLRTSPAAIASTDRHGNVVFANDEARRLLGLRPSADGQPLRQRTDWIMETEDGRIVEGDDLPWARVARTGAEERGLRYVIRFASGKQRVLDVNAAPISNPMMGAEVVFTVTDITESALAAQRLARLAAQDPLTGMYNRRGLDEAAERMLIAARQNQQRTAFLLLDLDHFRSVNDLLRHEMGDAVLKVAARRMESTLAGEGLVARMGGDEFMAVVQCHDLAAAAHLAEAMRSAIAEPITVGPHTINLTASVGVSLYPTDGLELPQLISSADIALFAAKRSGRNCTQIASSALFAAEERRSALAQALAGSDFHRAFSLAYQPQSRVSGNGEIIGAEALLRWIDPVLGSVSPSEFIPLAEEMGAIQRIDAHVIKLAAQQLAEWKAKGIDLRLSINVSGRSLSADGFADHLLKSLREQNADPHRLMVELTETAILTGSAIADHNMEVIRAAGVSLAIDDFGTGYASLSYLQRMDVSEIKIDHSFVAGLQKTDRNESEELIGAIVALAKGLGLSVVAEGVETPEQALWLRDVGCDLIQGRLVGQPVSPEIFAHDYAAGLR
jgi:diguanylate cyclase (GGDEF)-like protein/PAS domain S-box-containing protein